MEAIARQCKVGRARVSSEECLLSAASSGAGSSASTSSSSDSSAAAGGAAGAAATLDEWREVDGMDGSDANLSSSDLGTDSFTPYHTTARD